MDRLEFSKAMSVHARGREPGNDVIEGILNAGGHYAVEENPAAQVEWNQLVDYLNQFADPKDIIEIDLPVDVHFYQLAYFEKKFQPTMLLLKKQAK